MSDSFTSKVSVLIPFFNRGRFLRSAVKSVLAESESNLEIIAVDDGSTDGGRETVRDLPVRLIRHERRRGPSAARNSALEHATGDFIYFFDSDDLLVPGALRWALDQLRSQPGWQGIGGRVRRVIDEAGVPVEGPEAWRYANSSRPPLLSLASMKDGGGIAGGLWLFVFRSRLVREVGRFDEELELAEDRDYLLRVLKRTPIPLFDRPMIDRRVHGGNLAVDLVERDLSFKPRLRALTRLVELSHLS